MRWSDRQGVHGAPEDGGLVSNGNWRGRPAPPQGFASSLGLNSFQAHLLYNRGVRNSRDADAFFSADTRLLHDPGTLPDIQPAVERLVTAIEGRETIAIYGDFDTDGITGTALLVHALREFGTAPLPYIPDRTEEGHGLNQQALVSLRGQSVTLLITVDCGATAVNEVAHATALGMDVIITDHHTVDATLPDATAVVNPRRADSRYPFPGLTGAGLALKLAQALFSRMGRPIPGRLLQMAALGTIADVGALVGENRVLVKLGLEGLRTTTEPGIAALAAMAGIELAAIDSEALSFSIIPRLNAAGRLGHASSSLDLLTTRDADQAHRIAGTLDRLNAERQKITESAMAEARRQLSRQPDAPVLFVGHPDWLPGILGLVAGRLAEENRRPVVAIAMGEETSRASVRSIPQVDIHAALNNADVTFVRFGGHAQAAGFTVASSDMERLKKSLAGTVSRQLSAGLPEQAIEYDCEVPLALLQGETMDFLHALAPHGEGNPEPVFLSRAMRVMDARLVGQEGRHLKMRVSQYGAPVTDAIAFRMGSRYALLPNRIDLLYTIGIDTWGGRPRTQLKVVDFRPAGI